MNEKLSEKNNNWDIFILSFSLFDISTENSCSAYSSI